MAYQMESIFVGGSIEAQGLSSRLESAGITTLVKDHGDSGRLAGFATALPGETEVFVNIADVSRAKKMVADMS